MVESIFPSLNDAENNKLVQTLPLFKEYAWNFENNDFIYEDGKIKKVEGIEAIKIWIWKSLHTERYKYMVYTWDYGNELEELIGKGLSRDAMKSEVERYLKETLLINLYIKDISNVNILIDGSQMNVDFIASTVYGEVDINV